MINYFRVPILKNPMIDEPLKSTRRNNDSNYYFSLELSVTDMHNVIYDIKGLSIS